MALYDGISKKLFSRTTSKVALLILVLFSVVRLLMLVTLKDQFEFNFNVAFGIRSRVDLRILLMTYARPNSLHTCLNNLDLLKFENSSTTRSLDIWIDRDRLDEVDITTYELVKDYKWSQGSQTVNIHRKHAGVFGQWIQTWIPEDPTSQHKEIALFLEDDIDISPFAWKWLKKVKHFYRDRTDIAMFCLQDDNAVKLNGLGKKVEVVRDSNWPVFLYAIPGSWGCSPNPDVWADFRGWFLEKQMLASLGDPFRPYVVQAILHTAWYKVSEPEETYLHSRKETVSTGVIVFYKSQAFEQQNRADSMWTMWFIYYCRENQLFGLYSNLPEYYGASNVSLAVNRKESGMHYKVGSKRKNSDALILRFWDDKFINFPVNIPKFGFNGEKIIG